MEGLPEPVREVVAGWREQGRGSYLTFREAGGRRRWRVAVPVERPADLPVQVGIDAPAVIEVAATDDPELRFVFVREADEWAVLMGADDASTDRMVDEALGL